MITTREDLGNSGASVERRVPLHLGDLIPEVNNVTPLCRPSLQTSKMLKVRCFCASNFWLQQHSSSSIEGVLPEHASHLRDWAPDFTSRKLLTTEDFVVQVSVRRHQRPKSRKLVQQRDSQGKSRKVNFESVQEGRSKAGLPSSPAREILAKYRFPRKSSHFESDRMVPTGPNPLHNSNRSQVIFP